MLLGFVLGKLMEEKLRQSLILSRGSFTTFIERPVSAVLLAVAALMLVIALLPSMSKKREEVFTGVVPFGSPPSQAGYSVLKTARGRLDCPVAAFFFGDRP